MAATPKRAARAFDADATPTPGTPMPGTPGGEDIHDMAEPVFDHHAYPELIDAILNYAPPASLLVFRGTDRHYRGRVDDMLFEHVIVRPEPEAPGKGKGRDVAAKPSLPGFELLASHDGARLPLLPYDPNDALDRWLLTGEGERPEDCPASQAREDCREDIAGRIRVVDLYGRPRVPFPFAEAFRDLEIVRRPAVWGAHDEVAFAPTVVDFVDLGCRPPGVEGTLHIDPGEGVVRHVVHIALVPPGSRAVYKAITFAPVEEVRDLVLVFSTRPASDDPAAAAAAAADGLSDRDVFWHLTELARSTLLAGGKATYVGVDAVDVTADLGDAGDENGTAFEKHLTGALQQGGADTPTLEEAMARVSFVSAAEWRAALPEENVEFEAEWPSVKYE